MEGEGTGKGFACLVVFIYLYWSLEIETRVLSRYRMLRKWVCGNAMNRGLGWALMLELLISVLEVPLKSETADSTIGDCYSYA